MYRILVVGKLEAVTEALYRSLETNYQVQLCNADESMENVVMLTRITKPNMVILNTVGNGDINEEIFAEITKVYSNIPILTIGLKEHCEYYNDYFNGKNIISLFRPITSNGILECCASLLGEEVAPVITPAPVGGIVAMGNRKKVLIVDDSAITLRSVKAILDKDYEVSVATSGERAIQEMKKELPDIVLMDYEMPGFDGRETFEMMSKDMLLKNVPVVFLTAVADKDYIAAVLQLSPAGYLLKPPDKEVLKDTIAKVLSERR